MAVTGRFRIKCGVCGFFRVVTPEALWRKIAAGTAEDGLTVSEVAGRVKGPGHRAQLHPVVGGREHFHLLGPVSCQAVLEVDGGDRRGQVAQATRRSAHQPAQLADQ